MTGILVTIPRAFALTAAANEAAGARLHVYENLTTTPVALFSDRACAVPAANPIVSAAGYFPRRYMATAQLLTLTMTDTAGAPLGISDDNVDQPRGAVDADALYQGRAAMLTALAAVSGPVILPQGRLTLTSATPVTTADATAQTTIYYTPYHGNIIPLYDGTDMLPTTFAELSQLTTDTTKSPAAAANNSNYDMFVWNDNGTLRCTRGPAWTSDTGRGTGAGTTELELVKGVYLNKVAIVNGPGANRGTYVGTVRSNGSAQINDSLALRMVWNAYNRVTRAMRVLEATDSWAYSTAAFRQANNSAANQLSFVRGLNEDGVSARVTAVVSTNKAAGASLCYVSIGLDAVNAGAGATSTQNAPSTGFNVSAHAHYAGVPGLGYHFLAWLEHGSGADTQTWFGDAGSMVIQAGITGEVRA